MTTRGFTKLRRAAELGLREALARGATAAAVGVSEAWERRLERRDGVLDEFEEATANVMMIRLFKHERYGVFQTSDLRPDALGAFLDRAIDVVGALAPDPLRALPDPALYRGRSRRDLDLVDPLPPVAAGSLADSLATMEHAARKAAGEGDVASIEAGSAERRSRSVRLHSDGFRELREATSFSEWCAVTLREHDGRRPVDRRHDAATRRERLMAPERLGDEAARRALARLGGGPWATGMFPVVVEARTAARLVEPWLDAVQGSALSQRRSFLNDRLGTTVASGAFTLHDDPLIPGGLGSRRCDGEGMATRRRVLVDRGVLRGLLLDTYHARKLGLAPTSGSPSNVVVAPGERDLPALLATMGDGLLITGFLGGNVNGTTADFSLGIVGSVVEGGRVTRAVAGANLSGNLLELFGDLVEVGCDPLTSSSRRVPSLRFRAAQVSGR